MTVVLCVACFAAGAVGGAYGWPKIKKLYAKFRSGFESV